MKKKMGHTQVVAQRCIDIKCDKPSDEVKDRVKYLALDYLGIAIRCAQTELSKLIHRFCKIRQGTTQLVVPVIATPLIVNAPYAALEMCAATHSLELDDVVKSASLHPAVSVISADLSVGYDKECSDPKFNEHGI